jgi:3-dehydrosphinganine reductase
MFDGKRIVITGGSSGAGKELARQLLARGANVALLARDAQKLEAARNELAGAGRAEHISVHPCDVTSPEAVETTFASLRGDGIDMLFCSAGVLTEGRFDEQPLDAYHRVMNTNFFGTLHCVRAALPELRRSRGRIVNIASVAGLLGVYGYGPYCSSKHALVGLSETMRIELAPQGVRVHLVCPPEFDSPMVDELERYRSRENRAMARGPGVMTVKSVAAEILAGLEKDRFLIVTGRNARIAATFARLFPTRTRALIDRSIRRSAASARAKDPGR